MAKGLPKVASYVKNVGKSVAFAAIDGVVGNAPGVKDFAEANNEVFKEVYASVRNYRETIRKAHKSITESKIYEAAKIGLKNLKEDLKSGDFYTYRDYSNEMIGLEDDDDEDYYSSSSSDTSSFDRAIGGAARAQCTTVTKAVEIVTKTSEASTKVTIASLDRNAAMLSSSIGTVYTSTEKINQFLNTAVVAHMENSRKFFETQTSAMNQLVAMNKEMLEMQRNLYKSQQTQVDFSNPWTNVFGGSGSIDLKAYAKVVKKNIKTQLDYTGLGLLGAIDIGGGNPYLDYVSSPMKIILSMAMGGLLSKDLKKAIGSLDKGLTSMFSNLAVALNKAGREDDGSFFSLLGKIFGVEVSEKRGIDTAKYAKGAVPFDGVTRKAIIETIPGYLSRIEAVLTGRSERHFDYGTGTWKSAEKIGRDFDNERNNAVRDASWELRDAIRPLIDALAKQDKASAKSLERSTNKMYNKVYDDGGFFDPRRVGAWKYYGFASKQEFDNFMKAVSGDRDMRNAMRGMAGRSMNARRDYNYRLEMAQANGSPYVQLFNGAYDLTGEGSNKRMSPTAFAKGTGFIAQNMDDRGRNVFWYLREILDTIRATGAAGSRMNSRSRRRASHRRSPRTGSSSSSSSSGTGSSDEGGPGSDEPPSTDPDLENGAGFEEGWAAYDEERKKKAEEASKKNLGGRVAKFFGKTKLGNFMQALVDKFGSVASKPMDYMTKLLNKADENLFKLFFGEAKFEDDEGKPINGVFDYIIHKVKKSFEDMTKWIKSKLIDPVSKKLKEFFKPLWEKYGKPIKDAMGNMFKSGKSRFKQGMANTFGKVFKGGVVTADEFEEAAEPDLSMYPAIKNPSILNNKDIKNSPIVDVNARGSVITKRGLTMVSPGEIIIPASFDPREQKRMEDLERRDRSRIARAISLHAKGTVNMGQMKDHLKTIYEENKDPAKAARVGAGGVLGAGAGLLLAGNPLLGALAGAGLSIIQNSETLKKSLFGEELADGTYKEGVIPKSIVDAFKKYGGDMGDFGIAGGVLGLLTPFGPLGGAAIGAGIGFLKNNETFKKFIFGDEETGEGGLISKETREKAKKFLKKSVPAMGVGALAGIFMGPFGLLGNAVLGAGAGLLSSTSAFHKFVFGDPDNPKKGSLVGAIKNGILNPAKKGINGIIDNLKGFGKKNILDPLKNFGKELAITIKNAVTGAFDKVKDFLNGMFEKTIGIPIHDFLQEKIFKPITKTIFGILKAPLAVGKAIVSAPFKVMNSWADSHKMKRVKKGQANDMSAAARLKLRGDKYGTYKDKDGVEHVKHGIGDKFVQQDEMLAGMNEEQLKTLVEQTKGRLDARELIGKEVGEARAQVGQEISAFFNSTDADGNQMYDKVGFGKVKKIAKVAAEGDVEAAYEMIDDLKKLTSEEKARLKDQIGSHVKNAYEKNSALKNAEAKIKAGDKDIEEAIGRKFSGTADVRQLNRAAEAELKARAKAAKEGKPAPPPTDPADAVNLYSEIYKEKTDTIISKLTEANTILKAVLNPEKAAEEADKEKPDNSAVPTPDVPDTAVTTAVKDMAKDKTEKEVEEKAEEAGVSPDQYKNMPLEDKVKSKISTIAAVTTPAAEGVREITGADDSAVSSLIEKSPYLGLGNKSAVTDLAHEDSKEAIEARKEQEQEEAEEDTANANAAESKGFLQKIHDKLFGDKKKKSEGGILGKIGNGIGSLFSFFGGSGTALKIGLGVVGGLTLVGTLGDFFKDNVWPPVKKMLFGTENEDGTTNGGLLTGLFNKVKGWLDSQGGIHGILLSAFQKMLDGWDIICDKFVAPAIELLIQNLPRIFAGLASAIGKAITSAIFNKDLGRSADHSTDEKASGISGLLGATKRTNQVEYEYDENGNRIGVKSGYTQMNTTDSLGSKVAKASGEAFIRSAAGTGKNIVTGTLTKVSTKGVGKGLTKVVTGGAGTVVKGAGSTISGSSKIGNILHTVAEASTGNTAAASAVDNLAAGATKNVMKNAADDLAESGIKTAAKNIVKNSTDNIGSKITAGLTKVFKAISNSKIGAKLLSFCSAGTTKAVLDKAMEKISKKLGESVLGKVATKGLGKIAGALAGFSPLAIVIWVKDFFHGFDNADTILGVAKGDDTFKVNFGHRCICGLLEVITNQFTFGLLPSEIVVDICVEFLFPLFGLDVKSLKAARENAQNMMDQWNMEHPDETYDNLEDFNNKDKWWFKAKKGIQKGFGKAWDWTKETAGKAWDGIKTGAGKAWDGIKTGAGKAWNWTKETAGKVWNNLTGFFENLPEKMKELFETFKKVGSNVWKGIQGVLKCAWSGDMIKAYKYTIKEDKEFKIASTISNVILGIGKVMFTPVILITSAISNIIKFIKKFVDGAKKVVPAVFNGVKDTITGAWKGELWSGQISTTGNELLDKISNVILTVGKIITTPVQLIAFAIGKVVGFVKGAIEAGKVMIPKLGTAVGELFKKAWTGDDYDPKPESTGNDLMDKINNVMFGIIKVVTFVPRTLTWIVGRVVDVVKGAIEAGKVMIPKLGTAVGELFKKAWTGDDYDPKPETTGNVLMDKVNNVLFGIIKVVTFIPRTLTWIVGRVVDTVKTVIDAGKQMLPKLGTAVGKLFTNAWNGKDEEVTVESTGNTAMDKVNGVIFGVVKFLSTPIRVLTGIIGTVVNKFKEGIAAISKPFDAIKLAFDSLLEGFNAVGEKITGFFNTITEFFENTIGKIGEFFGGFNLNLPDVGAWIGNTFGSIKDGLVNAGKAIGDGVNWVGDKIGDGWNAVTGWLGFGRKHIYQSDPKYKNKKYGPSTIGESGCAPVAATNAINNIFAGRMNLDKAAKFAEDGNFVNAQGGTSLKYFESIFNANGIGTKTSNNPDYIMNALKHGHQVVMLGMDKANSASSPFGIRPHFITALGLDRDGNIIIEDPDIPQDKVKYNAKTVLNSQIASIVTDETINAGKGRNALTASKSKITAGGSARDTLMDYESRRTSRVASGGATRETGISYEVFLETIIGILMSIASNTSILAKILEILSEKFNLNLDKTEIQRATQQNAESAKNALRSMISSRGSDDRLVQSHGTQYLLDVMSMLASE